MNSAQTDVLTILYQDENIVAIHKPAGLLVHKSPIDKHETRYAMKLLRDQLGQWVYPVHRLDKPTSGCLLFALNPDTAKQLSQAFEAREIHKQYKAIVRGWADQGVIDHPLKEIAAFKHQAKTLEKMEAKEALTHYRSISTYELPCSDGRFPTSRYSLLEFQPETGRKHQIRRHAKHISHPIIGDVKYGKGEHNRLFNDMFNSQRLLLAATQLSFTHPHINEAITINCPLEDNFQAVLDQLGQYVQK